MSPVGKKGRSRDMIRRMTDGQLNRAIGEYKKEAGKETWSENWWLMGKLLEEAAHQRFTLRAAFQWALDKGWPTAPVDGYVFKLTPRKVAEAYLYMREFNETERGKHEFDEILNCRRVETAARGREV